MSEEAYVPCTERVYGAGSYVGYGYPCSRRGVVLYDGRMYCKQHDPATRESKVQEKQKALEVTLERDRAIQQEAEVLSKRLGVTGHAHYDRISWHYERSLVISFKDAEDLIDRIRELENR